MEYVEGRPERISWSQPGPPTCPILVWEGRQESFAREGEGSEDTAEAGSRDHQLPCPVQHS